MEFPSKTQKIILNTLVVANQFEVKFSLNQLYWGIVYVLYGFLGGSDGEESACNAGDLGSILGLGRSPGEWKGSPLQYTGLENSMGCIVHGVAKSRTQLSDFHFHSLFIIKMLKYSQPQSAEPRTEPFCVTWHHGVFGDKFIWKQRKSHETGSWLCPLPAGPGKMPCSDPKPKRWTS